MAKVIPALDGRVLSRDEELELFGFLTLPNLVALARSCATVEETHQVGRLASMLYGPPSMKPPARRTPLEVERVELKDLILATRRSLTAQERTVEERQATALARETESHNTGLRRQQHRRAAAVEGALERRRRGDYLTPYEKELLTRGA
ncbi:hypothetical protein [Nocardioides sp.]|uniref:hypothetical protein n=1 Tax=Nocardioides sp. TaxID=35761 RepID=UPI003567AEA5